MRRGGPGSASRGCRGARGPALLHEPWRAVALAVLLGGCTIVGKDYRAPALPTPAAWTETEPGVAAGQALELARWWTVFQDPVMDSLMENAASANLDLRLAEARVREARAQRGVVAAGEWPRANAGAVYRRSRDNLPPAPPEGAIGSVYQAGFDATWEIDVFGGVRREVEAADAAVDAAVAEFRSVLVTLFGEVARNYVDLRGFQRQLSVNRDNIGAQQEALAITRARLSAGLTTEFDVTRAEAQLATTESQIPSLEASLRRTLHRLAVLLGREPGALVELLSPEAPIPAPPPQVQVGLPSDLLRRRPDVRRAERELAAATALIGVAEADLFPRFSLTGFFGLQTRHFDDLADWSSRIWSIGPRVRWPIFDAGRIRSNIQVQNEREILALTRYEKALLTALEDVENALVSYGREDVRRRSLATAASANARALETVHGLYRAGLTEYLQVLDVQRSLYVTQTLLVQSEAALSSNLVALYKALGGGWENDADLPDTAQGAQ